MDVDVAGGIAEVGVLDEDIEGRALAGLQGEVDIAGGGVLGDYQIDLYYDFNPDGPNSFGDLSGLGRIDLTASLYAQGLENLTVLQGSQNQGSVEASEISDATEVLSEMP